MSEHRETVVMSSQTPAEMARAEAAAEQRLNAWVHAFINFPNSVNYEGLSQRMIEYQNAWMNGRERP